MRTAVIFPGQGAQYVGMATELAAREPLVAETLAEADEVLGLPLSRWIAEGPAEQLAATAVTQPAVLAVSVAYWRVLRRRLPELVPIGAAGHSLGEYSALVAAGAVAFADALRLVHLRGRLMQEAVPRGEGGMLAVLGLDEAQVRALCDQARGVDVLDPACFNGPGQIVVAGHAAALARLAERAAAAGAMNTVALDVSAPFHTRLLEPAGRGLERALAGAPIHRPAFPVVQNVDTDPGEDPEAIRRNLVLQVTLPVRWEGCARRLIAMDAERAIEVGPGNTLTGLYRRIVRRFPVITLDRTGAWDELA